MAWPAELHGAAAKFNLANILDCLLVIVLCKLNLLKCDNSSLARLRQISGAIDPNYQQDRASLLTGPALLKSERRELG